MALYARGGFDLGREIGRLGLAGRCRLVGHISDVGVFHHALDVFVQSSDHEGTPNAILEAMARSGADVLSIDWRLPIQEARMRVGERVALQGNLDPCLLLGSQSRLTAAWEEILKQAGPTGHIMNLGHGILPMTPVENARTFIESARNYRRDA